MNCFNQHKIISKENLNRNHEKNMNLSCKGKYLIFQENKYIYIFYNLKVNKQFSFLFCV